jgi:hypothetical protein
MEELRRNSSGIFFKGKIVIVYLTNVPEAFASGIAISNPKVENLSGRSFVIGEVPIHPDDWTSGLRTGIALDQIAHFLEFADEKEFTARNASAMKPQSLT